MLANLICDSADKEVYAYYPEGKGAEGVVAIEKHTCTCSIEIESSDDECRVYAMKMCSALRQFAHENDYKQSGMIAWYL